MSGREEWESLGRALAEAKRGLQGGPDCPAAARLWEAAAGELPPRQAVRVADHASQCSSCASAYRLAVAIQREVVEPSGGGREGGIAGSLRRQASWGTAIAALLVLGLALSLWHLLQPPPLPHLRGPEKPEIVFSTQRQEALPRDSFTLGWQLPLESASFDVAVQAGGTVLDRAANLRQPRHTVPPEKLERLPSGAAVLWLVTARLEDGRDYQYTHILRLE